MSYTLKLTLFDIFRFDSGEICILCDAEPRRHHIIFAKYPAKIVVEGVDERPLNIIGQEILVRHFITERNSKTIIRINDKIDDLLEYMGKKPIYIFIEIPEDEISQEPVNLWEKYRR